MLQILVQPSHGEPLVFDIRNYSTMLMLVDRLRKKSATLSNHMTFASRKLVFPTKWSRSYCL